MTSSSRHAVVCVTASFGVSPSVYARSAGPKVMLLLTVALSPPVCLSGHVG